MENQKIEPHKITKPIQLVAAWLVGLIIVNAAFLAAAHGIEEPTWLKATLIIASIANVPIFLGAIFLLQTKFRPQLQEDPYYSQYLDKTTNEYVSVPKEDEIIYAISQLHTELVNLSSSVADLRPSGSQEAEATPKVAWSHWRIALCDFLPDFDAIRKELKELEIPVNRIFGKANTKNIPIVNVVSFNREVDFGTIKRMLKILSKYNFDGYCYSIGSNSVNEEEIYIGGFGYMNTGYYPMSDKLIELINSDSESVDLKYLESQTKVVRP